MTAELIALIAEARRYVDDCLDVAEATGLTGDWPEGDMITALADALEAATGTPKPGTPGVHWECDCVPDLGPTHCHACGEAAGRIIEWSATIHAPVGGTE